METTGQIFPLVATRIRTWSPGFENKDTLKCWFCILPTTRPDISDYVGKVQENTFQCMVVFQYRGQDLNLCCNSWSQDLRCNLGKCYSKKTTKRWTGSSLYKPPFSLWKWNVDIFSPFQKHLVNGLGILTVFVEQPLALPLSANNANRTSCWIANKKVCSLLGVIKWQIVN